MIIPCHPVSSKYGTTTIDDSPIHIAYGMIKFRVFSYLFMIIVLCTAPDDVNAVVTSVGTHNGCGSYFDLHTGSFGFGTKVSPAVIAVYFERYCVPMNRSNELMRMAGAVCPVLKNYTWAGNKLSTNKCLFCSHASI